MFNNLKNFFRRGSNKNISYNDTRSSFLLIGILSVLEDILFWDFIWLSISFICLVNIVFIVCVWKEVSLLSFIFSFGATVTIMDATEAWLKYKHRNGFLKIIGKQDHERLKHKICILKTWIQAKLSNYGFVHDTNPTKAFLSINIILGSILLIGKYVNGYLILYALCMFICVCKKAVPPVLKVLKRIQQNAESDTELEGLMPEESDLNIKLLAIETEATQQRDEKQSLDYWKPVDIPLEDGSDSSESGSIVTNLSMHTLEKDVETSDSSDDEYMPHEEQKEELKSTVEVVNPASSWSGTAYNTLWNITGAVSNLIQTQPENKRKRVTSNDSSDGFEIIDKNELT